MSNYILPLMVLIIVVYGIIKKVDLYDVFLDKLTKTSHS